MCYAYGMESCWTVAFPVIQVTVSYLCSIGKQRCGRLYVNAQYYVQFHITQPSGDIDQNPKLSKEVNNLIFRKKHASSVISISLAKLLSLRDLIYCVNNSYLATCKSEITQK